MKPLIDECLSVELALLAREHGYYEASHITWIGRSGWKDWQLKPVILQRDWTNQVLEVTLLDADTIIEVIRYKLPAD